MNKPPFFSVIVPTHTRAILLRRALESIKSQACPVDVEVIVISDASDRATDEVCAELLGKSDMYIRRNGEKGPSASRNLGLSLAKGNYILFLDDDDAWHPNCLAQLYDQPHVRLGLPVYFNCSVVTERRLPQGPEPLSEVGMNLENGLTPDVYVKNQVHMSCFAFPKHLLQGLEFDPFMRAYEDWDYLLSVFDRQRQHVGRDPVQQQPGRERLQGGAGLPERLPAPPGAHARIAPETCRSAGANGPAGRRGFAVAKRRAWHHIIDVFTMAFFTCRVPNIV